MLTYPRTRSPHTITLTLTAALGFSLIVSGCGTAHTLESMTVTPSSGSQVLTAVGQTAQYHAIGTYGGDKNGYTYTQDITNQVTWTSLNLAVATVSANGVVTAASAGSANIQASTEGFNEPVTAMSNVAVTPVGSGTPSSGTLTSITIIPGSQAVTSIYETGQFIAIGNYSGTPATLDMTNQVTWASSDVTVGKITQGGLASGLTAGSTTITATATAGSGAVIVGNAGFSVSSQGSVTLPVVAVDRAGVNAALGTVTATYQASTGAQLTPINCGPQSTAGQCSATFPPGTFVFFQTSDTGTSPQFGGWSGNCNPVTATNNPLQLNIDAYSCFVQIPATNAANIAVGAIFE